MDSCNSCNLAEMSTDQDWIWTAANFGRIRTGSICNFLKNWRIRTASDWENYCFIYVIIF